MSLFAHAVVSFHRERSAEVPFVSSLTDFSRLPLGKGRRIDLRLLPLSFSAFSGETLLLPTSLWLWRMVVFARSSSRGPAFRSSGARCQTSTSRASSITACLKVMQQQVPEEAPVFRSLAARGQT